MGVSLSWVAVRATTANELYTKLGLAETGARGDYYDFPMAGLTLPSSWHLLTTNQCEHQILSAQVLRELSAGSSAVACSVEEHVMYMSAALWRDGREIWSVQHRGGDYGIMDLVIRGSPPEVLENLRSRYFALQAAAGGANADVDHIADIPLELAKSIVGFKHDEINPGIDDTSFRALRQESTGLPAGPTRPKWKFW
jgi:hypothetical protein